MVTQRSKMKISIEVAVGLLSIGIRLDGRGGEREMQNLWVEYVISVRVKYMGIGCEFV